MGAEFSANARQTVQQNGSVIFTEAPVPCNRGLVFHRDESGLFRLASPSVITGGCYRRRCCCDGMPEALYAVSFHANAAIPAGGAVEPVSFALFIDGEEDPSSIMTVTPAAAEQFFNIGTGILVAVPWICRCASVSVRNVGTGAADIQNANIVFDFAGIRR